MELLTWSVLEADHGDVRIARGRRWATSTRPSSRRRAAEWTAEFVDSTDGACVDLVVDLEAMPDWRITGVRYWGYPSDRWHLPFDPHSDLPTQLSGLVRTLPDEFS